jgi:hypothetical protein
VIFEATESEKQLMDAFSKLSKAELQPVAQPKHFKTSDTLLFQLQRKPNILTCFNSVEASPTARIRLDVEQGNRPSWRVASILVRTKTFWSVFVESFFGLIVGQPTTLGDCIDVLVCRIAIQR